MKIIVLGGAGDMGSRAVEELAEAEGVEQVTIADRNLEDALQLPAFNLRCDLSALCALSLHTHAEST